MAKVLTSLSGNLISAASAGYAPTNSSDVSAIASAYQVVSATATQLYAGTAYVTSLNSAPISASRAGNAANASMATSAYYDGTGRLISSLPDAATVSAIASAYADDKLDKTAEVVTATAGDGTYITSINGMGLSGGGGGGGGGVVTATGSASALEGYWPVTTAYLVSSINGSALLPYGYSALSANSSLWSNSKNVVTANSANWNSVYNTVSSNSASWSGSTAGASVTSPSGTILVMNGTEIEGTNSAVLTSIGEGFEELLTVQNTTLGPMLNSLTTGIVPGTGATLLMALSNSAYTDITVMLSGMDTDYRFATASGIMYSGDTTASIPMDGIVSAISASADQWINLANGQPLTAKKDGDIVVTGVGELAWQSAVDNVTNTVSANSATWGQGGVDSATVSSIASSYAESAASSKADSSALSSYALSADVSGVVSAVSSNSASWAAGISFPYGFESGSCSAVLTTGYFANTSRPSFIISSQDNVYPRFIVRSFTGTGAKGSYYLSDAFEFTTGTAGGANSGTKVLRIDPQQVSSKNFLLFGPSGSNTYGYLELRGVDNSAYINIGSGTVEHVNYVRPSSISSWWDTHDLVSSQSANWGGSALALSAGPGVKLEKVGDTLVASTDETVLWSSATAASAVNLSETLENFEKLELTINNPNNKVLLVQVPVISGQTNYSIGYTWYLAGNTNPLRIEGANMAVSNAGTTLTISEGRRQWFPTTGGDTQACTLFKVVGINRTAGV